MSVGLSEESGGRQHGRRHRCDSLTKDIQDSSNIEREVAQSLEKARLMFLRVLSSCRHKTLFSFASRDCVCSVTTRKIIGDTIQCFHGMGPMYTDPFSVCVSELYTSTRKRVILHEPYF